MYFILYDIHTIFQEEGKVSDSFGEKMRTVLHCKKILNNISQNN